MGQGLEEGGLEGVVGEGDDSGAGAAEEVGFGGFVEFGEAAGFEAGGGQGDVDGYGAAGDRDGADELAGRFREGFEAGFQEVFEGDARGGFGVGGVEEGGLRLEERAEVSDQGRVAGGFAGDGVEDPGWDGSGEELGRELAGVGFRERGDFEVVWGEFQAGQALDQGAQRRVAGGVAGSVAGQQQDGRGGRGADQVLQQGDAVLVRPLQAVEGDDDGAAVGEPCQELAHGVEAVAAAGGRIEDGRAAAGGGGDRGDPAQDPEQLHQGVDVAGQHGGRLGRGQGAEVAAQRIYGAVEGAIRDLLAFVASAADDADVGAAGARAGEKAVDQGVDARAGGAVDQTGGRFSRGHDLEQAVEDLELGVAADERGVVGRAGDGLRLGGAEGAANLDSGGAIGGVAAEHRRAKRVEIGVHGGGERARRGTVFGLLGEQHVANGFPLERQRPRQHREEHGADRIPVGGGADLAAEGLLRRHVRRRADEAAAGGSVRAHDVVREAEVEDDHPLVAANHDVRRLQVAVQQTDVVQGRDAGAQLAEDRPYRDRGQLADRRVVDPADRRRQGRGVAGRPTADRRRRGRGVAGRPAAQRIVRDPGRGQPRDDVGAVDQLHGEEPAVVLVEELVEPDQARVRQARDGPEFAFERPDRFGLQAVEGLEGDRGLALTVVDLVDDAHRSGAQTTFDFEPGGPRELHRLRAWRPLDPERGDA